MQILDFARLRAAVALLGADSGAGWWRGRALDGVGQAVLSRLFPTAPTLAALGAATAAATRVHDEHIGRSGVYHAFRLPAATEADLSAALADQPDALDAVVQSPDAARQALRDLAGDQTANVLEGPQSIGDEQAIMEAGALQRLASLYVAALEAGRPVYPYVTAAPAPSA